MEWKVFQADVLDALKQYEGYLDFFERTGTLSDSSRPDCIARRTRVDRKIWIFDAKNKSEIEEKDEERMEKYVNQVKSDPVDLGLDHSELSDHEIIPVFVTSGEASSRYRVVEAERLHQYMRKNLVYTETDRVVRDVASMAEKQALSHGQARLLYRSLEDFRKRMQRAERQLRETADSFTGFKLLTSKNAEIPVDFKLEHEERPDVYIDVPYRDETREAIEHMDQEGLYVSLGGTGKYGCSFEEFEEQLSRKLGILPWRKVVEIFSPKAETETRFQSDRVQVKTRKFRMEIESRNDTGFRIAVEMPERGLERLKDRRLNARKEFGEIRSGRFHHSFEVKEGLIVDYGFEENLDAYRDTVNSIFHSAVNPVILD